MSGYKGWEHYIPPTSRDGANLKPAKRSKYGNRKTTVDGLTFDSAKEARRWTELMQLLRCGDIRSLKRQPWFALVAPVMEGGIEDINAARIVGRSAIGEYRADFSYERSDRGYGGITWTFVVEDTKGFRTDIYKWKKRHFEAQYGISILET